ncbi:MAG: alpha/beta fold hydrolase [Peptococcaceae bacterium]|nr:alpha/beta fold hydrolase [Peptococcaceae bacterium]
MITTCEKIVADIPCFEIAEADEEPLVELLLYHGWGSNAEKQRFRGQLLAAFGYRVIVPEIPGHGVRGALAYDGPQAALDFQRVLLQSIGECVELAQAVFHPGRAHFLVGHSLGGMITLGALTPLARALNGVVAMNSTANWADATAALAGVFCDGGAALAALASDEGEKLRSALDAFDPARWSARGITTPVLLTNGSLDQTLPASLNADFLSQQQLPQVRQVVIEDAGHVVTDSALREVVAFIESHR